MASTAADAAGPSTLAAPASAGTPGIVRDPKRWWVLAILGVAQLMVVLDATIVNIALPTAQRALHFSDGNRQWIVTAYALAFGSLLPLGGRLADLVGRRRIFIAGIIGFAVASAIGGAAPNFGVLVTARALQGGFGALLAPAALSLLTITFADPAERGKAFAVYGGIAGAGGGIGLLLGGLLTEYLSWRWCLYVNLAFAALAFLGALAFLHASRPEGRQRLDLIGTLLACGGLFLIVFGFSHAETASWGSAVTIAALVGGVVLLAAFVQVERTVRAPLLPMRILLDRARGGANLGVFFSGVGMFGMFLFLTYYLQGTLGYSPVKSGVAFLPVVAAITVAAGLSTTTLMPRFGPRVLVVSGQLLAAAALVLFAVSIGTQSSYAGAILPGLLLVGVGIGLTVAPGLDAGTYNVLPEDAGVASSLVNTSQQVGGSIGTALLNTIAATALGNYLVAHGTTAGAQVHAAVHSYVVAFWWAAAIFALGALVCALVMRGGVLEHDPDTVRAPGI